jgi:hypothetical protein
VFAQARAFPDPVLADHSDAIWSRATWSWTADDSAVRRSSASDRR